MLYSLLFDAEANLIAAAPTCDQIEFGDSYWLELIPDLDWVGTESAVVEIENPFLRSMLDELKYTDERQRDCNRFIKDLIFGIGAEIPEKREVLPWAA